MCSAIPCHLSFARDVREIDGSEAHNLQFTSGSRHFECGAQQAHAVLSPSGHHSDNVPGARQRLAPIERVAARRKLTGGATMTVDTNRHPAATENEPPSLTMDEASVCRLEL